MHWCWIFCFFFEYFCSGYSFSTLWNRSFIFLLHLIWEFYVCYLVTSKCLPPFHLMPKSVSSLLWAVFFQQQCAGNEYTSLVSMMAVSRRTYERNASIKSTFACISSCFCLTFSMYCISTKTLVVGICHEQLHILSDEPCFTFWRSHFVGHLTSCNKKVHHLVALCAKRNVTWLR